MEAAIGLSNELGGDIFKFLLIFVFSTIMRWLALHCYLLWQLGIEFSACSGQAQVVKYIVLSALVEIRIWIGLSVVYTEVRACSVF